MQMAFFVSVFDKVKKVRMERLCNSIILVMITP